MGRSQVLGAWALRFMVCCNAMCFSAFRTCFMFCIGIISLLYSRVRIWPKKKKQSDCCLLVVATLKYQVISCKLLFNLVSWPRLSRASTGGKGFYVLVPHSHGGPRPLANCRYSNPCVNIGTPQGTPRADTHRITCFSSTFALKPVWEEVPQCYTMVMLPGRVCRLTQP